MLHMIGRELEAKLVEKNCPYQVVDREPRGTAITYTPRIVLEHDGDDKFGDPRGLSTNPKKHYTRTIGAKLTIYGKSLKPGAQEFEHRRVVEQVLDIVLVGMRKVAAERLNRYVLVGGKFIVPEDLAKSEIRAGAAYELKFTFDRAVSELTWEGEKFPEASIGTVQSTNRIWSTFDADNDGNPITPPPTAEIACGGEA